MLFQCDIEIIHLYANTSIPSRCNSCHLENKRIRSHGNSTRAYDSKIIVFIRRFTSCSSGLYDRMNAQASVHIHGDVLCHLIATPFLPFSFALVCSTLFLEAFILYFCQCFWLRHLNPHQHLLPHLNSTIKFAANKINQIYTKKQSLTEKQQLSHLFNCADDIDDRTKHNQTTKGWV